MSESGSKTPSTPKAVAAAAKKEAAAPRPSMKVNEKLIGRTIIGSGAPKRSEVTG